MLKLTGVIQTDDDIVAMVQRDIIRFPVCPHPPEKTVFHRPTYAGNESSLIVKRVSWCKQNGSNV